MFLKISISVSPYKPQHKLKQNGGREHMFTRSWLKGSRIKTHWKTQDREMLSKRRAILRVIEVKAHFRS